MEATKHNPVLKYFVIMSVISGIVAMFGSIDLIDNALHLLIDSANAVTERNTLQEIHQKLYDKLLTDISCVVIAVPVFIFHFRMVLKEWRSKQSA
jgi:hypothetical protein